MARGRWAEASKKYEWLAFKDGLPFKVLRCRCGSTAVYLIRENRPFKVKTRNAHRRRFRAACASCGEPAIWVK